MTAANGRENQQRVKGIFDDFPGGHRATIMHLRADWQAKRLPDPRSASEHPAGCKSTAA